MGKIYDSITWLKDGERANEINLNRPLQQAVTKIESELYDESGNPNAKATSITETFPYSSKPTDVDEYSVVCIDSTGRFVAALDDGVKNNFVGIIKVVTTDIGSKVVELQSVGEVVFPETETLVLGATYYLSKTDAGKITTSPTDTTVGICVKERTLLLKGSSKSGGGSGGAQIDDTTTALDKVWSSQKVSDEIASGGGGSIIDDLQITATKVWSSLKTNEVINEKPSIDDQNPSNTTTWSSNKILASLVDAAGVVIDDKVITSDTTWSSDMINKMTGKTIAVGSFGTSEIGGGSSAPAPFKNESNSAMIVNLNMSVKTDKGVAAGQDTYIGDIIVYYNDTAQQCIKESIISRNISGVDKVSQSIGCVILDSGDSLIFSGSAASIWADIGITLNHADVTKSGGSDPIPPTPGSFVNGLLFTALSNGSKITIEENALNTAAPVPLEYKIEYSGAVSEIYDYTTGTTLTLNQGDKIIFRAKTDQTDASYAGGIHFVMSGKFAGDTTKSVAYLYKQDGSNFALNPSQFKGLFKDCDALVSAPKVPFTTTNESCYQSMFENCTGIEIPPALPATLLDTSCYEAMFKGCTALTSAPALLASNLADYCYKEMFKGCSAIANSPELPATTLSVGCYQSMFEDCSLISEMPILSSTTLKNYCYQSMFKNCSNLYVTEGSGEDLIFTCPSTSGLIDPTTDMFVGTAGSFTGTPQGGQGYYRNEKPVYEGLRFTAEEASTTVALNDVLGAPSKMSRPTGDVLNLEYRYSLDGNLIDWEKYTIGTKINLIVPGDWVEFRNQGSQKIKNNSATAAYRGTLGGDHQPINYYYYNFSCSKDTKCTGNIMFLFDKQGADVELGERSCYKLFSGTKITSVPELPATQLGGGCYDCMFENCSSLVNIKLKLPAKKLVSINNFKNDYEYMPRYMSQSNGYYYWSKGGTLGNYQYMFQKCSNLENIDITISAEEIDMYSFAGMFFNCNKLKNTPKLDNKTLYLNTNKNKYAAVAQTDMDPSSQTNYVEQIHYPTNYLSTGYGHTYLARGEGIFHVFYKMFYGCSSLIETFDEINLIVNSSATNNTDTMYRGIFEKMFCDCTSLTKAPNLTLTIKNNVENIGSFLYMFHQTFYNCANLETAPEKMSIETEIGKTPVNSTYNFYRTFEKCAKLKTAPVMTVPGIAGNDNFVANNFTNCFLDCSTLKVSQNSGENKFFTLAGTASASKMFDGTAGSFTGNAKPGVYYYNE